MKPAPHLSPVVPAAVRVLRPPLFAVRHCEAALQRARGRVQADQASADLRKREAFERERALRNLIGRART